MTIQRLNGIGDLAMDGDLRPYIGTEVEIVGVAKSELIKIRAADGTLHHVPKRNLDPIQTTPMTNEQIVLNEIRRHIETHPHKGRIESLASAIRLSVATEGEVARIAIALVGAELAAES